MWRIESAVDEKGVSLQKNRRAFFTRKYPDSVRLLDKRLEQIRTGLEAGMPLRMALSRGWVHPEKAGVFAVCTSQPELRLYFLPLPKAKVLLILTIGDKSRQSADVVEAANWAKSILSDEEKDDGHVRNS